MGNLNMWSAKIFMYSWMAVMVHGTQDCDKLATSGDNFRVKVAYPLGTCTVGYASVTAPSNTECTLEWNKVQGKIEEMIKSWKTAKKSNYYECLLVQALQPVTVVTPSALVQELAKTHLSGASCAKTSNQEYDELAGEPDVLEVSQARTTLFGQKPLDAVCEYLYPTPKKIKATCAPLAPVTPKKCGALLKSQCGEDTLPYKPYEVKSVADLDKLEKDGKKKEAEAYRAQEDAKNKRMENVTEDVSKVVCSFLYPTREEQKQQEKCKEFKICEDRETGETGV